MEFVEVTDKNWESVIQLKPKNEQAGFLRTNIAIHSLAKAYVTRDKPDRSIPFAIENEGELVGAFLFRDYKRGCNLTGFFIDEKFQGRGFGKKALAKFIDYVKRTCPSAKEIELTIAPGNTVAEKLYQSFGFKYTGEKSDRGNLYMELHFD